MRIGLVGDYNPDVIAHQAIPRALELAGAGDFAWLGTGQIRSDDDLVSFDAIWCVPASPYRSLEGALRAIRFARESGRPFLGTCGGFQHAVLEYARHVLGWSDAEHGESVPEADRAVIAPLSCSMVEVTDAVSFTPGSRLAKAYEALAAREGYHCNYGINRTFAEALTRGPLRATSHDAAGEIRGIELEGHPFFVATLFQPERAALRGVVPPIVTAFVGSLAPR